MLQKKKDCYLLATVKEKNVAFFLSLFFTSFFPCEENVLQSSMRTPRWHLSLYLLAIFVACTSFTTSLTSALVPQMRTTRSSMFEYAFPICMTLAGGCALTTQPRPLPNPRPIDSFSTQFR